MADFFHRRGGALHCEQVALADIAARFGTPCYVYSRAALIAAWRGLAARFGRCRPLLCYAVKANGNLSLLSLLAREGAGFDIVSGGELARVCAAGGDAAKVVFSGVGKRGDEIAAALACGVLSINAESPAELERIESVAAQAGKIAPVGVRLNPAIDAPTHPHIATGGGGHKFGVAAAAAGEMCARIAASDHLRLAAVACHIGSQIFDVAVSAAAARAVADFVAGLAAPPPFVDLGGGFGFAYGGETPPDLEALDRAAAAAFAAYPDTRIILEPGRAAAAAAGVLLAKVEYLKAAPDGGGEDESGGGRRAFAVVDAAMNDFIRPALYGARHRIEAVAAAAARRRLDVAGPICESADVLGRDCELAVAAGDLIAVRDAGAYAMAMASNYNARPRPCEVLIDGGDALLIRRRETVADLIAPEQTPDFIRLRTKR